MASAGQPLAGCLVGPGELFVVGQAVDQVEQAGYVGFGERTNA